MAELKKYDLEGKEIGQLSFDGFFEGYFAPEQMVKDYIVAIRNNRRQWSASTKGRSEVEHTTRKPFRQKGTGNARQGCLVAPQYRGGGIVFGPKPKFDQVVRVNRKERKAAIRHLLGEKVREDKLRVVDGIEMDRPKTKKIVQFLKNAGLKGKVLFLRESEGRFDQFAKSIRNIPGLKLSLALNINGYDLLVADKVIVTEKAIQEVMKWLASAENKGAKK